MDLEALQQAAIQKGLEESRAKAAQELKSKMFLPQVLQAKPPVPKEEEEVQGDMLEPIMKELYIPYSTTAKQEPFISAKEIERQRVNKLASLAKNQPEPDENFITRGARKLGQLVGIQPPTLQERIIKAKEDVMKDARKSFEDIQDNPENRTYEKDFEEKMNLKYVTPSILEALELYGRYPNRYGHTAQEPFIRLDPITQKPFVDAQNFPIFLPPHIYLAPTLTDRDKKATEFHEFGHADAPNLQREKTKNINGQEVDVKYPGIFRDADVIDALGIIRHPDKDMNKQIVHDYYDSAEEYLTRYFTPLKFQAASKYGIVPTTPEEAEKIIDKIRVDKNFQQKAAEEIYDYNKLDDALDYAYKDKFKRTPTLQEQQEYKRNWIEDFKKNLKDLNPTNKNLQKALIYVSKADTGSRNA